MKNKYLIGLVVVLMLALAACGGQPTATNNTAGQPQSTSASNQSPTEAAAMPTNASTMAPMGQTGPLDPALATDTGAKEAISHVYESLVKMDDNGQPTYALANNVTVSEDSLDYIFALRPAVSFHDGTSLNADAVLANFNRWFDPQNSLHGSGSYDTWVADFGGFKGETTADGKPKSEFDGIEKVDDLTVIVHLNTPDPDLLSKLADPAFSIVNPAALQAADFGGQGGMDGGTGPYKIGTWSDSSLTLEPFSDYWDASAIPTSNMDITLGQ